MRIGAALIGIGLVVALAADQTGAELFRLKDGSVLRGTLFAVKGESLLVKTGYGARIALPKSALLAVEFAEAGPAGAHLLGPGAAPGSLLVKCSGIEFSSRASVKRSRRREEILGANNIAQVLLVDGRRAFVHIDSTMDKVIRKGPEEVFRNTVSLVDIALELPAGPHRVRLVVRNTDLNEERLFDPLDQVLDMGDVIVYPGKSIRLEVEKKRTRLGLGKGKLILRRP